MKANAVPDRPLEIVASAIYTPDETAAYLRLKVETLNVWRATGRYPNLRSTKVGGRVMYRGSDILGFLDAKPERARPYTPKRSRPKQLGPKQRRRTHSK